MPVINENGSQGGGMLRGGRVLAVHAHPDDEALWTGGALAAMARAGAEVHVVTCTLGEEGEVIGEPYQYLTAENADQLGGFRIHELATSLDILGVHGHFLGAPGRYRDSGMAGSKAHAHPRAFVNNTECAADDLYALACALDPEVIITYGPDGGYGHPDHIQAHRISHQVCERLRATGHYDHLRVWWAVTNRRSQQAGLAAITQVPDGWRRAADGELASVPESEVDLSLELDDQAYSAKLRAMAAHATQLWIADGRTSTVNPHGAHAAVSDPRSAPEVFALSNLIAQPLTRDEAYTLGAGPKLGSETRDRAADVRCFWADAASSPVSGPEANSEADAEAGEHR